MDSKILTVSRAYTSKYEPVPFIRLKGRWLEKLGFEIGGNIVIGEEYGRLVIIPLEEFKTRCEQGKR